MAEWLVRETQNLLIAVDRIVDLGRMFTTSRSVSIFILLQFLELAAFCRCLASVCETKLRLCVTN